MTHDAPDIPFSDDLVVTLLGRTTAEANDGQTITSTAPSSLADDVMDYARHLAQTEQARLPLTIINRANGVEAHAIVYPDGTVHDNVDDIDTEPVEDPGELVSDPPPVDDYPTDPVDAGAGAGADDLTAYSPDPYSPDTATQVIPRVDSAGADDELGHGTDTVDHARIDTKPTAESRPTPVPAQMPAPVPASVQAPLTAPTQRMTAPTSRPQPPIARRPESSAAASAPVAPPPPRTGGRMAAVARSPKARVLAAAATVAVLAAGGGFLIGEHGHTDAARPLDTYTGSGPGDTTSGPGAIFALNYAEYVYPRSIDGVTAVWPSAPAAQLTPYLAQLDAKTTHRLDITATSDPLQYTAALTVTAPEGGPKRFAQRYRLTRSADGKYRVADVTPAIASDDPISGTDAQPVAPTSAASAPPAAAQAPCPASSSGPVTTGNGPGGDSGAGVIEKFDYAYYVQRNADAARAVIAPAVRAQIAPSPGLDTSIAAMPAGTTHCLRITDTGRDTRIGRAFTVALTESQPGSTPGLTNQTFYVQGPLITGISTNR